MNIAKSNVQEFRGEYPLTKILPFEQSLVVDLKAGPSDDLIKWLPAFGSPCETMVDEIEDINSDTVWEDLSSKPRLWQSREPISFLFLIKGATRTLTHQLVRMRVGVSFSEHCSGGIDWRHHDVAFPESMWDQPWLLERAVENAIAQKCLYADAWDALECRNPETLRYLLPGNCTTYIFANISLSSLLEWYKRRACQMTQGWEMILLAERIKSAVIGRYPELAPMLTHPCQGEKSTCVYKTQSLFRQNLLNMWHFGGQCKNSEGIQLQPMLNCSNEEANTAILYRPIEPWYFQGAGRLTAATYDLARHESLTKLRGRRNDTGK